MSGSERYDDNASSPAFHFRRANDRVFRVVAAFDDDIGLEMLDEVEGRVFGKNYHEIDTLERREHEGAFSIAADGAGRSLQPAHGLVAVYPDDESISRCSRRAENVDVPGMDQVEDAVCESYPTLSSSSPPLGLRPCRDLLPRISRLQSLLKAEG
jgi:hypothetical protein